jgi:hypothetical protein
VRAISPLALELATVRNDLGLFEKARDGLYCVKSPSEEHCLQSDPSQRAAIVWYQIQAVRLHQMGIVV